VFKYLKKEDRVSDLFFFLGGGANNECNIMYITYNMKKTAM